MRFLLGLLMGATLVLALAVVGLGGAGSSGPLQARLHALLQQAQHRLGTLVPAEASAAEDDGERTTADPLAAAHADRPTVDALAADDADRTVEDPRPAHGLPALTVPAPPASAELLARALREPALQARATTPSPASGEVSDSTAAHTGRDVASPAPGGGAPAVGQRHDASAEAALPLGMSASRTNATPPPGRLQPVWVPFHSEMSANGFAARLTTSLDHPFRVQRRGPGRYQVVFAYADEPQRRAVLAQAAQATGLPL